MGCKDLINSKVYPPYIRFNRNILGCKGVRCDCKAGYAYRFNRNILGCKEGKRRETACGVVGFNRNILGCKGKKKAHKTVGSKKI